jgi:hypothetical protein
MVCAAGRHIACSVRQLPGNEQTALSANLHTGESLVEAWNQPAHPLRKRHGLRVAAFGLPVIAHHRLVVFIHYWRAGVVKRGIELDAIGSAPAGVMHLVHFVGFSQGAGADLDVLIAQGESRFHNSPRWRHAGGQLDRRRSGGGVGRGSSGCGGLGWGLSDCGNGACRKKKYQY